MLRAASHTPPTDYYHLETTYREKLDFLGRPENYPGGGPALAIVETHMAWVFLAGDFAYKLKKPIFHLDQDYSTIDARHRDHCLELVLNQRLAAGTYLAVEPLLVDRDKRLNLDGEGYPCDWLLKMRRLPADRMLDFLLRTGQAQRQDARAIGRRLGRFYNVAEPVAISFEEYRERFRRTILANEDILVREAMLANRVESLCRAQLRFIDERGLLLDNSLRANRVVECHGDLRPEHVCMEAEVNIIDCLQFCRDYRLMDLHDDAAFLALECERHGNREFGEVLLAEVATASGRPAPRPLLHFYRSFRAAIRARLALLHLVYGSSNNREKYLAQTSEYLDLSDSHLTAAFAD